MRNGNWLQQIFSNKKHVSFADNIRRLDYPFLQKLPNADAWNYVAELRQVNNLCKIAYFPGDSIVDPSQLENWQKASPDSWLVSKQNDEIVGYVHVELLSAAAGNAIRDGRSHEGLIITKDILSPEQLGSADYIHIGSIVNLTALRKPLKNKITLQLVAGIADRIDTLLRLSKDRVHYILAVDYPDINDKHNVTTILEDLGFEHQETWRTASDDGFSYNVYIIDLNKAQTPQGFDLTRAVTKRRNKYFFNLSKKRRKQLWVIAVSFVLITFFVAIWLGWLPSIVPIFLSILSASLSMLKDPDNIIKIFVRK